MAVNTIHDLVLTATFLRVSPGRERDAAKVIQSSGDACYVHKFFGSYDLLRLKLETSLIETKIDPRIDGLLESSSIHAPAMVLRQSSPDGFRSDFDAACQYPIVFIIFLQVRPRRGYSGRLELQNAICEDCVRYINTHGLGCKASCFFSYGKDDLLLIIGTDQIRNAFSVLQHLRSSRSDDILDTTSHVGISYEHIESSEKLHSLTEPVIVDIHATCAPGSETAIASAFCRDKYLFENILGKEDLRIISRQALPLGEVTSSILKARDLISSSNGLFATTTFITSEINLDGSTPNTFSADTVRRRRRQSERRNQVISDTINELERLRQYRRVDEFFIAQSEQFLTKFRSASFNEASSYLTCDLCNAIEYELHNNIISLIEEIKQRASIYTSEKNFQSLTINLTHTLAQRSVNFYDYRHGLPDLPQEFGQGVLLLSTAASTMVRQIYEIMEGCDVGNGEWPGFIYFSQFMGFKAFLSSVFSLPSNALSSILSLNLNWLTLSHEIAHDIWAELNIFRTPRDFSTPLSFRDLIEGRGDPDEPPISEPRYLATAEEMLGEWYAHWFDYFHFYSSDFEFFTWSIWSSWLRLPLVKSNLEEYFSRTLAVYVAHRQADYLDSHLNEDEFHKVTESLFDDLITLLTSDRPADLDDEHIKLIKNEKKSICKVIFDYLSFIFEFNRSCKKEEFAERMRKDVNEAYKEIEPMSKGIPIESSENIFAVLVASMKWLKNSGFKATFRFEFAFLLSCLFATTRNENCDFD